MSLCFDRFLAAFPRDGDPQQVDAQLTASSIQEQFGVQVPPMLLEFWQAVGSGYFANRELLILSENAASARDSIVDWNSKDFWQKIFPSADKGGPIFFAETCFGTQLGFRWENGAPIAYLLDVDNLEAFRLTDCFDDLFTTVLVDRYAITDPDLLDAVRKRLGELPIGMHFAPVVSPLAGGQPTSENYHVETPNVHLRTSIETWEALQHLRRPFASV